MKLAKTFAFVVALSCLAAGVKSYNYAQCALSQSIKVHVFESVSLESLERIIPIMEAHKHSHGFIVTYAGRRSSLAEAQRRADVAKRRLLETHGWINQSDVLNSRLNTLVCGYREAPAIELWVTPAGAAPPVCAPTLAAPKKAPKRPARA